MSQWKRKSVYTYDGKNEHKKGLKKHYMYLKRQRGMLNVDADVTDRWLVQGASAPRVLRSRSSRTSQTRGFWTTSRNGSKWTSRSCRKKSISPLTVSKRTSCYATWFTAGRATHRSLWCHWWRHNLETIRDREKRRPPHPWNPLSYPMVKTASLYDNFFVSDIAIFVLKIDVKLQLTNYDNFCKTGNYVIYDVIIWVQDGNCKKWLERMLVLVRSTI